MLEAPGLRNFAGVSLLLEISLHRRLTKRADERVGRCELVQNMGWLGQRQHGYSDGLGRGRRAGRRRSLWNSDLNVEFKGVGVGSFCMAASAAGMAAYVGMDWADQKHDAICAQQPSRQQAWAEKIRRFSRLVDSVLQVFSRRQVSSICLALP